jgi:hypothetical protein
MRDGVSVDEGRGGGAGKVRQREEIRARRT